MTNRPFLVELQHIAEKKEGEAPKQRKKNTKSGPNVQGSMREREKMKIRSFERLFLPHFIWSRKFKIWSRIFEIWSRKTQIWSKKRAVSDDDEV